MSTKAKETKAPKTTQPQGEHTGNEDWQAQHLLIQQLE